MFPFFEELFAPGRKHVAEERRRLESSRVDPGIGDPARGPMDLSSGKVTLRAPGADGGSPVPPGAPGGRPGRAAADDGRPVPGGLPVPGAGRRPGQDAG